MLLVLPAICIASTADDFYKDAEEFFVKGEYSAAIIQLKNTLLLEPDNVRARLLLGKAYLENGDAASAEEEITSFARPIPSINVGTHHIKLCMRLSCASSVILTRTSS